MSLFYWSKKMKKHLAKVNGHFITKRGFGMNRKKAIRFNSPEAALAHIREHHPHAIGDGSAQVVEA
ncbi:hypothetical protein NIAMH_30 [Serratia phage vB_SmaS_Niamh]|nr:hypothetical protein SERRATIANATOR_39 [Serratia phage vB_SmaS_Serratianator]UGO52984.1 hypothetical protein NIAMH_30 [Serratia phage vB_SmaS_Niamh]